MALHYSPDTSLLTLAIKRNFNNIVAKLDEKSLVLSHGYKLRPSESKNKDLLEKVFGNREYMVSCREVVATADRVVLVCHFSG
jgi:hypothetical protein